MTIASEITKLNTNLTNSYTACQSKGATMPVNQNFDNLATCIDSIQTGSSFTGINREVVNGVYKPPATSFTWSLPSTATDMSGYAMYAAFHSCTGLTGTLGLSSLITISTISAMNNAFYGCKNITSVDLSSLTTISGSQAMLNAFNNCTGLTSVDLSSLTTISGSQAMNQAFLSCTGLTGALDLSSLTTVSGDRALGSAFNGCKNITSVDLSNLTTVGANSSAANYGHFSQCFMRCNNLTSITFPKLEKIYCTGSSVGSNGSFANNDKVQKMYFPKLDTITYGSGANSSNRYACKNVFYGCSALTELHFAAANQAAIEASPGYSTAWGRGAGNVTIYFDL